MEFGTLDFFSGGQLCSLEWIFKWVYFSYTLNDLSKNLTDD